MSNSSVEPSPAEIETVIERISHERETFLDVVTDVETAALPALDPAPPPFVDSVTIQESLDDEEALRARLAAEPGDLIAGDQLEVIYSQRGDYRAVVELLLDRAEAAIDVRDRVDLLLRAARLFRSDLDDLTAARSILVFALAQAPEDRRIHEELDTVVCASGEFEEARSAFADAARQLQTSAPTAAGDLWLRVASMYLTERAQAAVIVRTLSRIETLELSESAATLRMCERQADDLQVLDALADLYRRLGDNSGVKRVLTVSLDHAPGSRDRARRHFDIAQIALSESEELEAEWHLAESVRLAPTYAPGRSALANIYRRRGESRRAASLLDEARAVVHNRVDRAELAYQAATIYANDLGERTRAVDLYQVVIANDPARAEAAEPLSERYWNRRCFAELEPLIEVLASRAVEQGSEDCAELCYRAGYTALQLGKAERALSYLRRAHRIGPARIDVLRALASAAEMTGDLALAFDRLEDALDLERATGAPADARAETASKLASLAESMHRIDDALRLYRLALAEHPSHEQALTGACNLLVQGRQASAAAELLRGAASACRGEDRRRVLSHLAALHARGLGDPRTAIEIYRHVLESDPANCAALTALAELYTAAENWRGAVEVLSTLAELEKDGVRRARYYQVAAQLARGRLDDERAASLYGLALESFFADGEPGESVRAHYMRAFIDLERLLRATSSHKALERAYRVMIRRLGADAPELADLWSRLGALYRELGQNVEALECYEVAGALGAAATDQRVVDLHENFAPDQLDALCQRRLALLASEPYRADHYRALAQLHDRLGHTDQAYLCRRVLRALGSASGDELMSLARLDARRPRQVTAALDYNHYSTLRHPDESRHLSAILAVAAHALAPELARDPRSLDLRAADQPAMREALEQVSKALGVSSPPLFIDPAQSRDFTLCYLWLQGRPTRAIVASSEIGSADRERLVHGLARIMVAARPGHILSHVLGSEDLQAAVSASLLAGGYAGPTPTGPACQRYRSMIESSVTPTMLEHLRQVVASLGTDAGARDLRQWSIAVEATCRRVALLLGNDLRIALTALERDRDLLKAAECDWLRHDLVVHSCSAEHAQVRRAIGLHIS